MSDASLTQKIEALLFTLGEPLERRELAKMTGASPSQIEEALVSLKEEHGRGIVLVDDGKTVELRTAGETGELIERVRKEEYSRDIGRAGLEALAAVLYRGPLSRAQIDFIRGVNSSQTLRTLSMRGLVRKVPNPRDERSFLYEPTTELLSQLGTARVEDLPGFAEIKEKLDTLEAKRRTEEQEAQGQSHADNS